jgi:preprotein translocase subunit SecD
MNGGSNWLVAITIALLLSCSCAHHDHVLTVHLADYSDSPPAGRIRVDVPGGEAPLYAEATPVLDDRDFRSASYGRDADGLPMLTLCFAGDSRAKFTRIVERNVHRRLVFLVRRKLLLAPIIDSGAVPQCATIQGFVSEEDAAALQRAIR